MTWHRIGNKPLHVPMITQLNDANELIASIIFEAGGCGCSLRYSILKRMSVVSVMVSLNKTVFRWLNKYLTEDTSTFGSPIFIPAGGKLIPERMLKNSCESKWRH